MKLKALVPIKVENASDKFPQGKIIQPGQIFDADQEHADLWIKRGGIVAVPSISEAPAAK